MEFRVLGPLEVLEEGSKVDLGHAKQRAVLAVLLLHRGEVVSTDRLVDELWGPSPPPTATKAIQVYVSHLRRALGGHAGVVRTQPPGYVLEPNGAAVDADAFESRVADARRLRESGDLERAATVYREALGLWRGAALADLAFESLAAAEAARLDELRLEALGERIDCDLELGRHAGLVGELEALVQEHPLREQFRRQLMLALYRAGRQADALDAYLDARRTLRDELGLEPGPQLRLLEQQILRHEALLDVPRAPRATKATKDARRAPRRPLAAVVVAAFAVVAAGAAAVAHRGATATTIRSNSLAALDARSGRVIAQVPVGFRPTAVAAAGDRVFVANGDDHTIWALDAHTRKRLWSVPVDGTVTSLSASRRTLWAAEFNGREILRIVGDAAGMPRTIALPMELGRPAQVAAVATGAWVGTDAGEVLFASNDGSLRRIGHIDLPIRALAYRGAFLWLVSPRPRGFNGSVENPGNVVRFDPRTSEARTVPVGTDPSAAAAAGDAAWAVTQFDGTLVKVAVDGAVNDVFDLHTNSLAEGPCTAGAMTSCAGTIAVAGGDVWVPSAHDRRLYRVDVATRAVAGIATRGAPVAVAATGPTVWVLVG